MTLPAPQPIIVQQNDSLSKVLVACLIVVLILVVGCIVLCLLFGGLTVLGGVIGLSTPIP